MHTHIHTLTHTLVHTFTYTHLYTYTHSYLSPFFTNPFLLTVHEEPTCGNLLVWPWSGDNLLAEGQAQNGMASPLLFSQLLAKDDHSKQCSTHPRSVTTGHGFFILQPLSTRALTWTCLFCGWSAATSRITTHMGPLLLGEMSLKVRRQALQDPGLAARQQDTEQGCSSRRHLFTCKSRWRPGQRSCQGGKWLTASQAAKLRPWRSLDVLPMKWLLDNLLSKYQKYAYKCQRECFRVFYLQIFNYIFCLNWFSKELKIAAWLGYSSPELPCGLIPSSPGIRVCGHCIC